MGVTGVKETSRDASISGTLDEEGKQTRTRTRSFLVLSDSPGTSPNAVLAATGISLGDVIDGLTLTKFRVRAADGVGMLWNVTAEYEPQVPEEEDEEDDVPGKSDIWSGSSSVTKRAIYKDVNNVIMTNSAGDPFEEGCLADTAENRLTLTTYRRLHTDWLADSEQFTNTCNEDNWNGGVAFQWKCQGCSKKLNIEPQDDAPPLIYWEITWEFAYNPDGWFWQPWDIGFNETTNEDGEPTSFGTGQAAPGRKTIKGIDGKGVRNPVALNGGVAKAPGLPPDALQFIIYETKNFGPQFGEVFTPGG